MNKKYSLLLVLGFLMTPILVHADSPVPVVVYTQGVTKSASDVSVWSKVRLYRVTNGSTPRLITVLGGVGNVPADILLSPDHQTIAVSFKHRVAIINQWTKAHRTIFTTSGDITGVVWAPDSSQVFIMTTKAGTRIGYAVNIRTGKITNGFADTKTEVLKPAAWRTDGYIIFHQLEGDEVSAWSLNLKTKKLYEVGYEAEHPLYSPDGKLVAIEEDEEHIADPCSGDGQATNKFEFKDTVTNQEHGYIGGKTTSTMPLAISPDGQESIFISTQAAKNKAACSQRQIQHYIHATRASLDTKVLTFAETQQMLQTWKSESIGATAHQAKGKYSISVPGWKYVTSSKALSIVSQYWQ